MKTEERKELRENSLVRWLSRVKESFANGPSKGTVVFLTVVVVTLVVFFGYRFLASRSLQKKSQRWMALYGKEAADLKERIAELKKLKEQHSGTPAGQMAELALARTWLAEGLSGLFNNKSFDDPLITQEEAMKDHEEAQKYLQQAADQFVSLSGSLKEPAILAQDVLFCAAQAYEGLGKFDEAITYYEQVQQKFEKSVFSEQAAERIKYIKEHRKELEAMVAALKPVAKPKPKPDPNKDKGTPKDKDKTPSKDKKDGAPPAKDKKKDDKPPVKDKKDDTKKKPTDPPKPPDIAKDVKNQLKDKDKKKKKD